jgi:hypothetical protein
MDTCCHQPGVKENGVRAHEQPALDRPARTCMRCSRRDGGRVSGKVGRADALDQSEHTFMRNMNVLNSPEGGARVGGKESDQDVLMAKCTLGNA